MRTMIERASERPSLRIAFCLAVATLVGFTVGHITADIEDHHVASLACVAIVLGIAASPKRRPAAHRLAHTVFVTGFRVSRVAAPQMTTWLVVRPLRR